MRAFACFVLMCCLLATWNTTRVGSQNLTQTAPNVVTDWALVAQNTIADSLPRRPARLLAMVPIAMHDAAVAIAGGYRSYTAPVTVPAGADETAAIATAAFASFTSASRPRRFSRASISTTWRTSWTDRQRAMGLQSARRSPGSSDDACGDGLETCIGPCSSNPPACSRRPSRRVRAVPGRLDPGRS